MTKPICVPCERFMRPKKNGVSWLEMAPMSNEADGDDTRPVHRKGWRAYKLWMADLWHCPDCHHEVIVGHGRDPIAMQHEEDFSRVLDSYSPTLEIKDC